MPSSESSAACKRDPNEVEALLRQRDLGESVCPADGLRPGQHGWSAAGACDDSLAGETTQRSKSLQMNATPARIYDRYRTIVADPPWDYPEGFALGPGHGNLEVRPLPYPSMTVEEICELRVWEKAEQDCRLFLWTTSRYLNDAFEVMRAWRFRYRQTLVWHKLDANLPASVAPNSAEFVLVGTRGTPERLGTLPASVIATTRSGGHSAKPEAWLDYFEQVSPGPYLEMFSRRARLGWHTWGDEALHGTEAVA